MNFNTDIFDLSIYRHKKFNLIGARLPNVKDIFLRAKQEEIYQQYDSARIFLKETETEDWNHWIDTNNKKYQEASKIILKTRMFESSLMFYNIVVDLSWVLCYVSAEFAFYRKDEAINLCNMINIEDAYKILRQVERVVSSPNCDGNQFEYLKSICPDFLEPIELVIEFWNSFFDSDIRKLYNFIKHKGKPRYEELENLILYKSPELIINNEHYPMDISDVQMTISLNKFTRKLAEFDDNVLYPYIRKLYELLENVIEPSPFV